MKGFKVTICLLVSLILSYSFSCVIGAEQTIAQDITSKTSITQTGFNSKVFLTDKGVSSYQKSNTNPQITLEYSEGIGSIYILMGNSYKEFTVVDNSDGTIKMSGGQGVAHRFVDLNSLFLKAPTSVTLRFDERVSLSEIYVFSQGQVPDFVQRWELPQQKGADIVLFSTHGDDEQLFFAGLLPLYAVEKEARVQVVYLTDHSNNSRRMHEMLNGLWEVGVRAYPVFGDFADFRIDDKEATYQKYESMGVSRERLQGFVVEQIRRFKPLVAIGHDLKGEYGHGMHMVYADLLTKAIEISADGGQYPESAEKYGVWEPKKTYLHLYGENKIVLDYDTPLQKLGGMTAFEVTQKKGYPCHQSQQYTWFTDWINGKNNEITKASQISKYSPCEFGLYKSLVGEDISKNDFLENITTYAQAEEIAQQALKEKLEAEKLAQQKEPEKKEKKSLPMIIRLLVIVAIVLLILLCLLLTKRKGNKKRR